MDKKISIALLNTADSDEQKIQKINSNFKSIAKALELLIKETKNKD